MTENRWILPAAAIAGTAAVGAGAYYAFTRSTELPPGTEPPAVTGEEPPPGDAEPTPTDDCPTFPLPEGRTGTWTPHHLLELPTFADVEGDLETNWGKTPEEMRPLFMWMEEVSTIKGSGRIFAVISWGESRWVPTARNGDGNTALDEKERIGSRRAWKYLNDAGFPMKHGEAAAEYGSGGLFGALSPYFLATGRRKVGTRAPLKDACPDVCLIPRVAAWGAVVYLAGLLRYYRIEDHLDIKVGWASPSYLSEKNYGGADWKRVREKFDRHAKNDVGIDFGHTATIPKKLSLDNFPGVLETFATMVGTLPRWAWT